MTSAELIDRQEAAEILKRSVGFVSTAVKHGYLTAKKLNPILVVRKEVEEFLERLDMDLIRRIGALSHYRNPDAEWKEKSITYPVRRAGEAKRPGRKPGSGKLFKSDSRDKTGKREEASLTAKVGHLNGQK